MHEAANMSDESEPLLAVTVGRMQRDEEPFVFKAWRTGYVDFRRTQSKNETPRGGLFDRISNDIARIRDRPGSAILVARDEEHPGVLHGFACVEQTPDAIALHYAYVPKRSKRLGVCTALLGHVLLGIEDETLYYTSKSLYDGLWESRYGMQYVDLGAWLKGGER